MTPAKPSTEDAVIEALGSHGDVTAAEIAETSGLGRSTVGKTLAQLEHSARVRRSARGREGAHKLPDRWSIARSEDSPGSDSGVDRLRPGQLDGLVLEYLKAHGTVGPLGPTAVAKALGRSSGAVGNCLARLAAASQVREVDQHPPALCDRIIRQGSSLHVSGAHAHDHAWRNQTSDRPNARLPRAAEPAARGRSMCCCSTG